MLRAAHSWIAHTLYYAPNPLRGGASYFVPHLRDFGRTCRRAVALLRLASHARDLAPSNLPPPILGTRSSMGGGRRENDFQFCPAFAGHAYAWMLNF